LCLTEAQRLEEQLTRSASLASSVSHKVKELDLVRVRVRETVAHVDAALEGGKCVEGLQRALAANNMEEAAKFIGRHRALKQGTSAELESACATVDKVRKTKNERSKERKNWFLFWYYSK
jgi:hypothetical protein